MKATVIAESQGRTLRTDALRPGRMHDATAAHTAGIGRCFDHFDQRYSATTATSASAPTIGEGPSLNHANCGRERPSSNCVNATGTSIPCNGSPSNIPSPATNAGNNSSGGPTAAIVSPTPTKLSPPWYPTAPAQAAEAPEQQKHASAAIPHQFV